MGTPEGFNKPQEEIEKPTSWEALGSEMRKIPAEAARTRNEKEEIAREVESTALAPSMIERYFQTIFGKSTGEYTQDIHKNYIAPLKSPTAKMVMKIILIYTSRHPEPLKTLGLDVVKGALVNIANNIAEEITTVDRGGKEPITEETIKIVIDRLPSFIEMIVSKNIEAAAASPETSRGEKTSLAQKFEELLDKDEERLLKLAGLSDHELDTLMAFEEEPPKGLAYFPGMPRFTYFLKEKGYNNFSLVKVEVDRSRATPDEKAYEIYFGATNCGRYTIRRKGGLVERNILFTYPHTSQVFTLPTAGNETQDLVRQAKEWFKIIKQNIKEKMGL